MDLAISFVSMLLGHSCSPNLSSTSLASEFFRMITEKYLLLGTVSLLILTQVPSTGEEKKNSNYTDFYYYPLNSAKGKHKCMCIQCIE